MANGLEQRSCPHRRDSQRALPSDPIATLDRTQDRYRHPKFQSSEAGQDSNEPEDAGLDQVHGEDDEVTASECQ